jgi:high-affinity nickel-transport protein
MTSLLSIIALGFFLGMRHATDPDHVIAVTTIVSRHRTMKHAALIGAFWGLGHTLTILAVGGGIILLGWVVPTRVGLSMEFSVGLMLILLGIMNLTGILQWLSEMRSSVPGAPAHIHSHVHSHGEYVHSHPHGHAPESHPHEPGQTPLGWLDRHFGRIGFYQLARPLVVGIVHGLAGSAAIALLVLTTIKDPRWAIVYLLIFGVGTIAGMMLMTSAIAIPFAFTSARFEGINRGLRLATGLLSLAFGLYLTYQMGIVGGLFSAHPQWNPR